MKLVMTTVAALVASVAIAGVAHARDQIKIVGSSTVFPYTQAVAEEYSKKSGKTAPVVESTGTGGGFKAFCAGVGEEFPDITGASRAIKDSEIELCKKNGVDNITEAMIGYDGLSIAISRKNEAEWDLSEEQIFKALDRAAAEGTAILCASTDNEQLEQICDRVIVFSRGRPVFELKGSEISRKSITEACFHSHQAEAAE